jgi:hypothetical protein
MKKKQIFSYLEPIKTAKKTLITCVSLYPDVETPTPPSLCVIVMPPPPVLVSSILMFSRCVGLRPSTPLAATTGSGYHQWENKEIRHYRIGRGPSELHDNRTQRSTYIKHETTIREIQLRKSVESNLLLKKCN